MRLQSQKMSVLGNNIANSTSIAYKGGGMSFIDTYRGFTGQFSNGNVKNVGNGIKIGNLYSDWTNGSVKETGLANNMAISGDGFFHVMGPDGVTHNYTRAGEFSLVETSTVGTYELMRPDGSVLMGTDDGGTTRSEIHITGFPDSWAVGTDGTITVTGSSAVSVATPSASPGSVQISMANFSNPDGLVREDNGLYSATIEAGTSLGLAESSGIGSITQGALEMSNVDLVNEFTELVLTQRAYSANSKTITTASEMLQEVLNLKR